MSDQTGAAASGDQYTLRGVQAGATVLAAKHGLDLKFVSADTQSTPAGALAGAQKLVGQDHVDAVIAVSALTFSAAPYLTAQGIPVAGFALDAGEWTTSKNMFSALGFIDDKSVLSTYGKMFKLLGITDIGSLGYGISPSSAQETKNAAVSAQASGLKASYVNPNFQYGSTNVQPIALAMKADGVDGFIATVDANTGLALAAALANEGAHVKAVLPTGYGGDLLQAGPGALKNAQGVYFYTTFEPVEMHTAATKLFQTGLKNVGLTSEPTYGDYAGYMSLALLVEGLEAAGPHASHAAIIQGLDSVTGFNGAGLTGSHSIDMANRAASAQGYDGCLFLTQLVGSAFHTVPGGDPICG